MGCSHLKIILFTGCSFLNSLSIMINNTFDLVGRWIICISPGIRNLITYIERSKWIDTQYIIDRRRPFDQFRRQIEKKLVSADYSVPAYRKETCHFKGTARFCFRAEKRVKVSRKVISFHNCIQLILFVTCSMANCRRSSKCTSAAQLLGLNLT